MGPCQPHLPGKQNGLLVAYARLAENLHRAFAEYTAADQGNKPMGRNVDQAAALTEELVFKLHEACAGYPWRSKLDARTRSWMEAGLGIFNDLRSPHTPAARSVRER